MNHLDRDELRRLVDEAKRCELDKSRSWKAELSKRSPTEIKRDTAARKAIFAAQIAHDTNLNQLAVVGWCGPDVYLVSVGTGSACVLDFRRHAPCLSAPEDMYALLASDTHWLPFTGDPEPIVAVAEQIVAAAA